MARTAPLAAPDESWEDGEEEDEEEESQAESEYEVDDDCGIPFAQVMADEWSLINEKQRSGGVGGGQRFSVAFSGGGVRAAAFQSGVLWRLAQMGKLKDVDYLTAVSGGGYIAAAYASHLLDAAPPGPGEDLDAWYRAVVARTLTRFQHNAGNFVRDSVAVPGVASDGSGCFPRIMDLPILVLTVFTTLLTNPTLFMVMFAFPAAEALNLYFGSAMRASLCAPPAGRSWYTIFTQYSPFNSLVQVLTTSVVLVFILFLIQKICVNSPKGKASYVGLCLHGATAFLARVIFFFFCLIVILYGTLALEMASYENQGLTGRRLAACRTYVGCGPNNASSAPATDGCSSFKAYMNVEQRWFEMDEYKSYYCSLTKGEEKDVEFCPDPSDKANMTAWPKACKHHRMSLLHGFTAMLTSLIFFAVLLIPFFPDFLKAVMSFAGPAYVLVLVMVLVEFRIFGPVTLDWEMQDEKPLEMWFNVLQWSLAFSLVAIPFMNEIRGLFHRFYRRSLRQNFFAGGKDHRWADIKENPYCPLLLFTGTVSDFKKPTDFHTISEVSFSPLYTGSDKCGYEVTPEYRSLSKCTALTGAGCLDAISLSMNDHLRLRFWLEVLNLSWGDYILFQRHKFPKFRHIVRRVFPKCEESAMWFFHALPAMICWIVIYGLFFVAVLEIRKGPAADCSLVLDSISHALLFALVIIGLSFFGFFRMLDWLMFSVILRNLQQATQYYFQGNRPPSMLYVTDGGVQDCTALVQLMRRRCERILLVLAAQDPQDDLGVLRTAMACAKRERLGCFYDPHDPERDLDITFEEYKRDKNKQSMHLGIRYGWNYCKARGPSSHGHLIIVKNRLPDDVANFRHDVTPLMTEAEIRGETGPNFEDFGEHWDDMRYSELGGLGCCDCCHHCPGGNAGAKWPQLTFTGYLYLTPQICNGLSRLAYAMSEDSIEKITRPKIMA